MDEPVTAQHGEVGSAPLATVLGPFGCILRQWTGWVFNSQLDLNPAPGYLPEMPFPL